MMAPYPGLSSSGSYAPSALGYHDKKDDILLQLTDRLRERELRSNLPLHLDVAYEELLAHCKEREEEFKKATEQHERESRDLENKCHNLEEKLEKQRRMLDKYEQEVADEAHEMENEIRMMHHRLEMAVDEIVEKDKEILYLENMVARLRVENDRLLDTEDEDKALIARLGKRVENIEELGMLNFQLEETLKGQQKLLRKKDEELNKYTQLHQEEMKNMELRLHQVIDLQRADLQERESEIIMLRQDIEKYEDILNEADYVTNEQRLELRAREECIDKLSVDIERREIERREIERIELEMREIERRKIERKEIERIELEMREIEMREIERREIERKKIERKENERKENERKENERKENERKKEIERSKNSGLFRMCT